MIVMPPPPYPYIVMLFLLLIVEFEAEWILADVDCCLNISNNTHTSI